MVVVVVVVTVEAVSISIDVPLTARSAHAQKSFSEPDSVHIKGNLLYLKCDAT